VGKLKMGDVVITISFVGIRQGIYMGPYEKRGCGGYVWHGGLNMSVYYFRNSIYKIGEL